MDTFEIHRSVITDRKLLLKTYEEIHSTTPTTETFGQLQKSLSCVANLHGIDITRCKVEVKLIESDVVCQPGIYLPLYDGRISTKTDDPVPYRLDDVIWSPVETIFYSDRNSYYILVYTQPSPESPTVLNIKGTRSNPEYTLYIGRRITMGGWDLPMSKWHNPFSTKKYPLQDSLKMYREHVLNSPNLMNSLSELSGHKLGCWCKPKDCHGDVLLTLYNEHVKSKK